MAVSHEEMKRCLKSLDCKEKHHVKKVTRYWLPETKEVFYVENENNSPQIVLHPKMIAFRTDLSAIDGVISKEPYYHNDDMDMYPKAIKYGRKPSHFGLSFEFDNVLAVESFIRKLRNIISKSK